MKLEPWRRDMITRAILATPGDSKGEERLMAFSKTINGRYGDDGKCWWFDYCRSTVGAFTAVKPNKATFGSFI